MTLDFRRNSPPPLIGPKEQIRILVLIGMMVLVLAAMHVAGRPESWRWMFGKAGDRAVDPVPAAADALTQVQEEPGVPAGPAEGAVRAAQQLPTQQVPSTETRPEQPAELVRDGETALDKSRLAAVKDKTRLRVRSVESEPYYYVLDFARKINPELLEKRARRGLTFREVFNEPEDYRGELLQLQGVVRRLIHYKATTNQYGITDLYEAWLYTDEYQQFPFVIVFTHLPEGMPTGDRLAERIRVAGYFFKINLYTAVDALRLAPMVLANRVVWRPAPPPPPAPSGTALTVAAMVAVALAAAAVFWVWSRHTTTASHPAATATEQFDVLLHDAAAADPEQYFRQIGEQSEDQSESA